MNPSLLDLIACPKCKGGLSLHDEQKRSAGEIESGMLSCGAHSFPIVAGIPRLLSQLSYEFKHTQQSFSSEWEAIGREGNAWGQTSAERRALFLQCCNVPQSALAGKRILDAGCGHGEVEFGLLNSGAEIVAVDLSTSVDQIRHRLQRISIPSQTTIHLIQANLHELPLKQGLFDIVHSAGVLHHTPDTFVGFKEVTRTLAPGGTGFIEVYSTEHKNRLELFQHRLFIALRKVSLRLSHQTLHAICSALAPFALSIVGLHALLRGGGRYRMRTWKEMELSLFDALSPLYDWHHSTEEVKGWFQSLGYTGIQKTFYNHNVIGIAGTLAIRQIEDVPKANHDGLKISAESAFV